jgi:hypothetical protein
MKYACSYRLRWERTVSHKEMSMDQLLEFITAHRLDLVYFKFTQVL